MAYQNVVNVTRLQINSSKTEQSICVEAMFTELLTENSDVLLARNRCLDTVCVRA